MSQQAVGNCFVCKKPVFEKDDNAWVEHKGKVFHLDHHGVKEFLEDEMKKGSNPEPFPKT
jgi:hypothetical protein